MRVIQLGPYPPPHGGVQSNLVAIRQFLLRRGISCEVINLTRFRRPDANGVYYPKNSLQLLWLLLRLRFDVLHLHIGGNLTFRLLALSWVCCCLPRCKAILTFHSGGYPSSSEGRATNRRSLRAFVLRRFDEVIAVNPEIVRFFEKSGVATSRIHLIPPHSIAAITDGRLPDGLRQFFDSHRPLLLTVGLLEPEYDLPLQIEVVEEVRRRYPDAGLAIVGSGSLDADLRARIEASGYPAHIRLCGDVEHDITLRAIASCDLFLRTTVYDGDSISVREALQLGVPVIASDNGMRPPGCDLIPASNLAALRSAIERRLSEPRRRYPHGTEGTENLEAVLAIYEGPDRIAGL